MTLHWKKVGRLGWRASRRGRIVGMVVPRDDGIVVYQLTAVDTKWVTKGYGEVRSVASAKRGLERAWAAWLDAYDLVPRGEAGDVGDL